MKHILHKGHFSVGLEDIKNVASTLYDHRDHVAVYTFEGSLGAGKTTLVQQLLRAWGVVDVAPSPTFSYLNVYTVQHHGVVQTLYHFDIYRLRSLEDFVLLGFDEYLYQPHSWAFIEWPEIIHPLLTKKKCEIYLQHTSRETRSIDYCCLEIE